MEAGFDEPHAGEDFVRKTTTPDREMHDGKQDPSVVIA
jgi:hypothetical protein